MPKKTAGKSPAKAVVKTAKPAETQAPAKKQASKKLTESIEIHASREADSSRSKIAKAGGPDHPGFSLHKPDKKE